ncbi:MAG: hypothetical protein ABIL45_03505 [candidate division WOR-3 bacterium]
MKEISISRILAESVQGKNQNGILCLVFCEYENKIKEEAFKVIAFNKFDDYDFIILSSSANIDEGDSIILPFSWIRYEEVKKEDLENHKDILNIYQLDDRNTIIIKRVITPLLLIKKIVRKMKIGNDYVYIIKGKIEI